MNPNSVQVKRNYRNVRESSESGSDSDSDADSTSPSRARGRRRSPSPHRGMRGKPYVDYATSFH